MKLLVLYLCVAVAYGGLAPLRLATTRGIPDRYIVRVTDDSQVDEVASRIHSRFSETRTPLPPMTKLRHLIPAVIMRIPTYLVHTIRALEGVVYLEQDSMGRMMGSQANPPWGLDRIDQQKGKDHTYNYNDDVQGEGVKIYVIDSGIQITHGEFSTDRAEILYGTADDNGHGSHCAGIAAGNTFGIARKSKLYSVKVCDAKGSCPVSQLVAGLTKVSSNGQGVVSISLSYPKSTSVNDAVQQLWDGGFTVSVAAGNEDADACKSSPQVNEDTITVGAIDKYDTRAYFSNYGSCVDLFAPGVNILSAKYDPNSDTGSVEMSGTSMACPHVSGAAALYHGKHTGSSPQDVKDGLLNSATQNVVHDSKGTDNKLLYINYPS